MRIIKLSPADIDTATREAVDTFFQKKLPERDPPGKFYLPKGWIAAGSIVPGERILFTYQGQCVYQALSASGRIKNEDVDCKQYPFYFCVNVTSLVETVGRLSDLEIELNQHGFLSKNLVRSHGWPIIDEKQVEVCNAIDRMLGGI